MNEPNVAKELAAIDAVRRGPVGDALGRRQRRTFDVQGLEHGAVELLLFAERTQRVVQLREQPPGLAAERYGDAIEHDVLRQLALPVAQIRRERESSAGRHTRKNR